LELKSAVIDKDRAAALLALEVGADALLLLTDVEAIEVGYGTPEARPLREATPEQLEGMELAAGSMGPKAEAAARFVKEGGKLAVVTSLEQAKPALEGEAGTVVRS
jgi:carbamate kinase